MKKVNPKFPHEHLLKHARAINGKAELFGHSLVWRRIPSGYAARCTDERCRINITLEDDGKAQLTEEAPLPSCPLNSDFKS